MLLLTVTVMRGGMVRPYGRVESSDRKVRSSLNIIVTGLGYKFVHIVGSN